MPAGGRHTKVLCSRRQSIPNEHCRGELAVLSNAPSSERQSKSLSTPWDGAEREVYYKLDQFYIIHIKGNYLLQNIYFAFTVMVIEVTLDLLCSICGPFSVYCIFSRFAINTIHCRFSIPSKTIFRSNCTEDVITSFSIPFRRVLPGPIALGYLHRIRIIELVFYAL